MTDLHSLARTLGGEVSGRSILCPGPGHSTRDRSLSVMPSASASDGFVVWSHAGDDPLAAKDYVKDRLGLRLGVRLTSAEPVPDSSRDRVDRARTIWRDAAAPAGTRVELYLRRRGLALPPSASDVLRYHRSCPFGPGVRTPCMVALIRSIDGNQPIGILRTALTGDGAKCLAHGDPKRILGSAKGGAVKLTPDDAVIRALGVAEGVENALSMAHVPEFGSTPSWALLSASGIAGFPILSGIESLWIAVDRDHAGEEAAQSATRRWSAANREVRHVRPRTALDLNDCMGGRA